MNLEDKYLNKKESLTFQEKDKFEDLILIHFQSLGLSIPDNLMTFTSDEEKNDYNPALVMDYCRFKNPGVRFIYPTLKKNHIFPALASEDSPFIKNAEGFYEPTEIDPKPIPVIEIILVPVILAYNDGQFAEPLNSLYHNFLSYNKNSITIGFCFFNPIEQTQRQTEELKLDFCITPYDVYKF